MKKKIAVIAMLFSIASVGVVSARGGMGYGGGMGHGMGYGQGPGYTYQQPDAATQAKLNVFYTETQDLRKQIIMKQTERQALAQATDPNPAAVSKISGELFDLTTAMQDKAKAAGLENYVGARNGRGIMGGGRGMMYGCRMM